MLLFYVRNIIQFYIISAIGVKMKTERVHGYLIKEHKLHKKTSYFLILTWLIGLSNIQFSEFKMWMFLKHANAILNLYSLANIKL